jgi:hypothetical protein
MNDSYDNLLRYSLITAVLYYFDIQVCQYCIFVIFSSKIPTFKKKRVNFQRLKEWFESPFSINFLHPYEIKMITVCPLPLHYYGDNIHKTNVWDMAKWNGVKMKLKLRYPRLYTGITLYNIQQKINAERRLESFF